MANRRFNGKVYRHSYTRPKKSEARQIARGTRRAGGRARVVPAKVKGKRQYKVYTRA